MPKIKERHEYYVFGIPVMKKFVYDCENNESSGSGASQQDIDNVNSNTNVLNCPEKSQFDNTQASLKECETKSKQRDSTLETAREQVNRLSTHNAELAGEKNELIRKVEGQEDDVKKLNESLESAKQREEDLEKESKILRQEKVTLVKDLDDTKHELGKCKNKNMDHEVRSMELLQEAEGLKKELKACK